VIAGLGVALIVIGYVRAYTADDENIFAGLTGVYAIGVGLVTLGLGLWLG